MTGREAIRKVLETSHLSAKVWTQCGDANRGVGTPDLRLNWLDPRSDRHGPYLVVEPATLDPVAHLHDNRYYLLDGCALLIGLHYMLIRMPRA